MTFPYRTLEHTPLQHITQHPSLDTMASVPAIDPNFQQRSFGSFNAYSDPQLDYGLQDYVMEAGYGQSGPWLTPPQSWMHTYPLGLQAPYQMSLNSETYAPAYMAHSGMPPNSDVLSWQHGIAARYTSIIPAILETSAIHTDLDKSSLRKDKSSVDSTTPTENLNLRLPHILSRASSYQTQASSQDLRRLSEDVDTSEDSWEDSSENNSIGGSTLVNLRTTQALAIDERQAYLLRHFVNNIRPCLSVSEPPLSFDGSSTWGEILPALALSCSGLLHGLMAASALHLAVLHGTSEAVPTKHFMVASRRLQKLLATPSSRHQVETLSLCLLLSWYEVMNADHARWIMHLRGASSFLLEHVRVAGMPPDILSHEDSMVDENLIEKLTGFSVEYTAGAGQFMRNATFENDLSRAAEREWKTRLDLFWWYIKMDVYHALLSGDPLLLSYDKWGLCPPRGRIGVIDQVHATIDHLWLVLGRLADFGGKDRFRKQRQVVASGGQWKPPPNFPRHTKPTLISKEKAVLPDLKDGQSRASKTSESFPDSKKAPPMNFYGMMPPPTIPPSMLSSFHINDAEMKKHIGPQRQTSIPLSTSDLHLETEEALTEHTAISDALETWRASLGAEFDSLPDSVAQENCPFGAVLKYSDPLVACMWGLYYLGRMLLGRFHPHSPPAMMMSAGVNAQLTHEHAQKIGKIHAGLLENQAELAKAGSINPTLVAALQELSFGLMFAGVQYQDVQQRVWTIDNLVDLAKSAGWKSAYAVASALETAWQAQAGMGKGPSYERRLDQQSLSDAMRHDRVPSISLQKSRNSESEHESRFVSHDRGLITAYADARAHWAIGVLSSADDVQMMFDQMKMKIETG